MNDDTDFEQAFTDLISSAEDPLRKQLASAVGILTVMGFFTWLAVLVPLVVLTWRAAF